MQKIMPHPDFLSAKSAYSAIDVIFLLFAVIFFFMMSKIEQKVEKC